ncbi:major vault protein-like [Trichechus manatus latirostris]|uniref:Major vault protein-like n=1 Tax=Trichechus manatus latirostris TaxID=127582 RepID=A0A2Y9RT68_TRIMA|nr:major vault protein-like [Trichechus manatus latirostris]
MVTVPPHHYCTVANPVSRDAQGSVLFDITGQVQLCLADLEIQLAQDPFPLYPGEMLEKFSVYLRASSSKSSLRALSASDWSKIFCLSSRPWASCSSL